MFLYANQGRNSKAMTVTVTVACSNTICDKVALMNEVKSLEVSITGPERVPSYLQDVFTHKNSEHLFQMIPRASNKYCKTYTSLWRLHVRWKVASGSWCEITDPITRPYPTHDSAEYCAVEQGKYI
jgi:hypothetical protein